MSGASTERRVAMLGLALTLVAIPLPALATVAAPREADLVAFMLTHGWLIIAFGAISGFIVSLTVVWLVGLRAVLMKRSRRWLLLDAALIVGVFGFVTTLVTYPILAALTYSGENPEALGVLSDVAFAVLNVGTGPATAISVTAFAVVIARTDLSSPTLFAVTPVVVAAHTALAVAFFPGGLLSPSGAVTWLAPFLYYLWVGLLSLRIMRTAQ